MSSSRLDIQNILQNSDIKHEMAVRACDLYAAIIFVKAK